MGQRWALYHIVWPVGSAKKNSFSFICVDTIGLIWDNDGGGVWI
jgi:hypothetical protein